MPTPRYGPSDVARRDPAARRDPIDPRDPFEIDRARIVHSSAFRRLQGKTQIFGVGEGDFFRTRLTHSMETAQIGKGLALFLNRQPELADAPLSTELVEAACLAHDLGHPPFGHTGEAALQRCMRDAGGFEGNAQNLRILTRLEVKRPPYGLDLTRATLRGILKYLVPYSEMKRRRGDGPGAAERVEKCYYDADEAVIAWIGEGGGRSLESQVMEWADDIAYSVHDLEDGLHVGMILPEHFDDPVLLERIAAYACKQGAEGCDGGEVQRVMQAALQPLKGGTARQLKHLRKGLTSQLIHGFIIATGVARGPAGELALAVPDAVRRQVAIMMGVEYVLLIRHPRVTTLEFKGKQVIQQLFEALAQPDAGDLLPRDVREAWGEVADDEPARLRVVCDYLAGMTDAYALKLYARLFLPGSSADMGLEDL